MQEITLKPCPFCGGSDIQSLKELDFVCCQDCGASLEDSEPSARELWNTRVPAQGEPVAWLYETWCGENAWSQRYTDAEPSKNSWTRNIRPLYLTALPSSPAPVRSGPEVGESMRETCVDCGKIDPCDEDCPNYIDPPKRGTGAGEAISPVSADDLLKSGEAQLVPTQAIEELSEQIKARDAQLFDMERQLKGIFAECAEIALEHERGTRGDPNAMPDNLAYDEACRDIAEAIKTRASNRKTMDAIADIALLKP